MKKMVMAALFLSFNLIGMTSYAMAQDARQLEAISMEKAKQIALKHVKGKVVGAKIEKDDGITKYEIIVKAKDGVYEVEIDESTGKVLEVEKEGHHGDGHDGDKRGENEDNDDQSDD